MVLEVVILDIKAGLEGDYENAFRGAEGIIASMKGHLSHQLLRCIEKEGRYLLLVHWERLEDHTEGFRKSPEFQEWRARLHHFYKPSPQVEHYRPITFEAG